jgi:hypothetical protein
MWDSEDEECPLCVMDAENQEESMTHPTAPTEFNANGARAEGNRLVEENELIGLTNVDAFYVGARWQHAQLSGEIARLNRENDHWMKTRMMVQDEKDRLREECERLRGALEEIANVRCAWQLSQEIARKALACRGAEET